MNKAEIEKEAPEKAVAMWAASGMIRFYAEGTWMGGMYIKEIPYDGPENNEFVAYRRTDGTWYWYLNQFSRAVELLENLGFEYKNDKWVIKT